MSKKRVLIIEDEQLQREPLHQALERRGFEVENAAGAEEARRIMARQTEPFDVVVLDMCLINNEGITGADLGIEFRRDYWQKRPPEFLINSAYAERSDYLKLAFELGAAAYLEKAKDLGISSVIQYVRALALRHGLSTDREDALETVQIIAASSSDLGETVLRFCKEILGEELKSCLGAPFVLLLTTSRRTYGWSPTTALPQGVRPEYETVQALTHGITKSAELFVLDQGWVESLSGSSGQTLLPALANAVFVPLFSDHDLRLSLGILSAATSLDKDTVGLGVAFAKYCQPAILKHLVTLKAIQAEMNARQLAMLKATSQFCLHLGQEQLTTLEAAEDTGEVMERGLYMRKIQSLSEDLCRAGELLGELAQSQEPSIAQEGARKRRRPVSMRETVDHAWQKVSPLSRDWPNVLALSDKDCTVFGRPDYLEIATSRVLQWLVQRLGETPPEVEPRISVQFEESPDGVRVLFEDRSRRLAVHLRQFLFAPLSQAVSQPPARNDLVGPGVHLPLYVAKTLVEVGNGGRLEDQSEDLGDTPGHRLVMSFPEANAAWT